MDKLDKMNKTDKMENPLLKYLAFVKTVERGSFTKAAEDLNYAQSSVSKMIGDLEKEWGMTLLERSKKGVCLTSAGEQLLPTLQKVLNEHRELEEQIYQLKGLETGLVRIGTFSSVAIHWLPEILSKLQEDYPGIEYEMLLGDYEEVEHWIDVGRVDCGFLRLPTAMKFDTIHLKNDEYKVILPSEHAFALQDTIAITDLEQQPFLLLEHGGKTEVSELLEKYNVSPDIRFTTWEDFAIMAMVEKGMGISILPELILKRIPYQLEIRSLQEPYYRAVGLAMKNRNHLTPAVQKFIEHLMLFRENETFDYDILKQVN